MAYVLHTAEGWLNANQIRARLEYAPDRAHHEARIDKLVRHGAAYSGQDFDVLAAAYHAGRHASRTPLAA